MRDFEGRVAAITGAGSGIGRALADALAQRGAHLSLSDIDENGLAETVARCQTHGGVRIRSQRLDVADRAGMYEWADRVVADHGKVNLIINNAGVALGATVEAMSYEDFEWLMNINFWGVVYGTKAFLPHLKESGEGHIVNLSSVFGLISVPSQSAYNAAKFAVRGFTDTLRMELEIEGANVSVTTIHPGGIKTNIARNARMDPSVTEITGDPEQSVRDFERAFITSPEKAAQQILTAVRRDRRRALIGPDAKVIDLVSRLPATLYQTVLTRGATVLRRQDSARARAEH
jgi:NAD(P)-dependent dehydrogenase (short-subunit alcohol dehydrogenase family)